MSDYKKYFPQLPIIPFEFYSFTSSGEIGEISVTDAFLDSGSTFSYIDEDLASALNLEIQGTKKLFINRFPNEKFETVTHMVLVKIARIGFRPFLTMPKLRCVMKIGALNETEQAEIGERGIELKRDPTKQYTVYADFLIGQTLLNEIVDFDRPTVKLSTGITVSSTLFGNYISGDRLNSEVFQKRQHL